MEDIFKFNTLVKFYYLFEFKQKISPLEFKFNKYKVFELIENKKYKTVEKIKHDEIEKIYNVSCKFKDMYDFIVMLILDYYNFSFKKQKKSSAIDFLIDNKKFCGVFYKNVLDVFLLIKKTPAKSIYKKISSKIYNLLIEKNEMLTELYLFLIYSLVVIKKKSKGENIIFDIFNQEALLREENEI